MPKVSSGIPTIQAESPIYPIRTAARLAGVNPRQIRAWEELYGLIYPARTQGGWRLYSEKDLARLVVIKNLLDNGATLKGLKRALEQGQIKFDGDS